MNPFSPAGLCFRLATRADGPAVRALIFAVLVEYGLAPDPAGTDADLADLEGSYAARGGMFALLEEADSGWIVGTVALMPVGDGVFELRKMYVHREWRGRGLGRGLLLEAMANARRLGARRLVLETASVLREAIALYRSAGFHEEPAAPHAGRCDRVMALDLLPASSPET